jgi:hypothetical protein
MTSDMNAVDREAIDELHGIFAEMADRTDNAEAIAARAEELRRAEWARREALQRQARVERDAKIMAPIADAVREALPEDKRSQVLLNMDTAKLSVLGVDCSWFVSVTETYAERGYMRYSRTATIKVVVGDYGNRRGCALARKTFPPKKDGTYSCAKIAEAILEHVEDRLRTERLTNIKARNEAAAKEVRDALGIDSWDYFSVTASADEKSPVRFEFKASGVGDAEAIIAIGRALRAAGMKLSYKG